MRRTFTASFARPMLVALALPLALGIALAPALGCPPPREGVVDAGTTAVQTAALDERCFAETLEGVQLSLACAAGLECLADLGDIDATVFSKSCRVPCANDAACAAGERCVQARCVVDECAAGCSGDTPACLQNDDCTRACGAPFVDEGALCAAHEGRETSCSLAEPCSCDVERVCAPGFRCQQTALDDSTPRTCQCEDTSACPAGTVCAFTGADIFRTTRCRPPAAAGERCELTGDANERESIPCAAGLECLPDLTSGGGKTVTSSCHAPCENDDGCGPAESCIARRCVQDECRAGCPSEAPGCSQGTDCVRVCTPFLRGLGEQCAFGSDVLDDCGQLFRPCSCSGTVACEDGLVCDSATSTCAAE